MDSILPAALASRGFDFASAFAWVRTHAGRGGPSQAWQMFWLSTRRNFKPDEYYLLGLYRPSLGPAGLRAYLSQRESDALNISLNSRDLLTQHALVADKMLAGLVYERAGLPVPRLFAHVSSRFYFEAPRTLATPEALCDFLRSPGALPCFGKPVHSSRAIGAVSLIALSQDGNEVTLGNGRNVPLADLAREIFARHADGYLLQELVLNAPDLAAAVGPTVASVRAVTVRTGEGPQILYTAIRLPAPNAMSDSVLGGRNMLGAIDAETGRIQRAQDLFRMSTIDLETHPVTGARLPGLQLPHWPAAMDMVLRAHRMFADQGLIGWDVLLTERGPLLNEANLNPFHSIYQRAFDRGLLNPDLMPLIDKARAHVAARLRDHKR